MAEEGPGPDAARGDEAVVEIAILEHVWVQVIEVCGTLTDEQWHTPTRLPGWTVKDNISHLIGIENMIRGLPPEEVELPDDLPHVQNDVGRFNEIPIEARRPRSGPEVLSEWQDVSSERLATLRETPEADFDVVSSTILGTMPLRDFMRQRALDSWAHQQDILDALDLDPVLEGPAFEVALARMTQAMGYVVGKKAGAPDGTTVLLVLSPGIPAPGQPSAGERRHLVTVEGGRGSVTELDGPPPAEPTVTLRTDAGTFLQAAMGRVHPMDAGIALAGDHELGERILANLNIMF
jgi:uncharacterized protein (TIGR03083 family)